MNKRISCFRLFLAALVGVNSSNSFTFALNFNNLLSFRQQKPFCNPGDLILSDNFQKLLCLKN